ncbi:DUF7680 family protein [Candidatus Methanodesulfokora washburnensis]|uniref:DUF7680 domain-containing protein n=1 Tax=Candidatus Methanodesulfokora washburnensis TaxID=2478471 RepID=A0A429GFR8_9CREN|nr:hypothetical protein [Candidatus Methanodesulfokores washburnensis]RSN72768.1 hypothetical protein D6D85_12515 [Candidatus Methanodesulfokores washburnensis]
MIYRMSMTRKPAFRVYKIDDYGTRRKIASLTGWKCNLIRRKILEKINMREFMSARNGIRIYELDEESAVKMALILKTVALLRNEEKIKVITSEILKMDRFEVYWWFSLYLKRGIRAISALSVAYT